MMLMSIVYTFNDLLEDAQSDLCVESALSNEKVEELPVWSVFKHQKTERALGYCTLLGAEGGLTGIQRFRLRRTCGGCSGGQAAS